MILAKFPFGQYQVDGELEVEEDLLTFGTANFTIGNIEGIEENQIVELYDVELNRDLLIFKGYIYSINPIWGDFSRINVGLRSEKAYFDKLLVLSDTTVSNTASLNALFAQYTPYNLSYNIVTPFAGGYNVQCKVGDSFFAIMDEVSSQLGAYRTIQGNEVIMQQSLGINRTSGLNRVEVRFDGKYPAETQIKEISGDSVSSRANIVIGTDGTIKAIASEYTGTFYGATVKEFRPGDLSSKTNQYLQVANKQKKNYRIQVEPNSINVNVGDTIKIIVENTNQFFDINADTVITNKKVKYNAGRTVEYQLQEFPSYTLTYANFNRLVSQQIKYNEIK